MKIFITCTRVSGDTSETTDVHIDHEGDLPHGAEAAIALLVGTRFDDHALRNVLGYEKLNLQASADGQVESAESTLTRDTLLSQLHLFKNSTVDVDNDGIIQSIEASAVAETDEDRENARAVLESLQAAGVAPQMIVGDLAQTSIGQNIAFTANTTAGSANLTNVSSMSGLTVGQPVTGPGIPANSTIQALGSSSVTLTNNATASGGAANLVAYQEQQVLALSEWSISWKRKTVDATTTDNSLYESSLGSTKSWSAKAKFMYVDGDPSQAAAITAAISTNALGALVWNFFPTVATGRAAFQGLAFIDGIDFGSGTGKIVGLDVSLKGTGPLYILAQTAPLPNPNTVTGLQAEV